MDWQLSLVGLLIGLLVGMTGMGGGSLMTPLLVLLFGFRPTIAIGTDIVHGAIFKSFGAVRHRQLGTVDLPLTLWLLLGSAPLSLAGVAAATWLRHAYGAGWESTARHVLGIALVACGIGFLLKALLRGRVPERGFRLARRDRARAVAIGAAGGFVVGLTSVGSGTFFGLTMMALFPLGAAQVVGTDIVHAAALLWVAGAGHILAGNVDFHATAWLLVGSIPGVLLGSQCTVRAGERFLRAALALTLFLGGVKLVDCPGANATAAAVAGVALLAALASAGLRLRLRRAAAGAAPTSAQAAAEAGS